MQLRQCTHTLRRGKSRWGKKSGRNREQREPKEGSLGKDGGTHGTGVVIDAIREKISAEKYRLRLFFGFSLLLFLARGSMAAAADGATLALREK